MYTSSGRHGPIGARLPGGAGGFFEMIFAREEKGEPLVRLTDKSLTVEFQTPTIGRLHGELMRFEFKLKDMALDGQPVF